MKINIIPAIILLCFLLTACPPAPQNTAAGPANPAPVTTPAPAAAPAPVATDAIRKKPRNVILLIGDGMGVSQLTAGLYSNNNRLNLERFPVIGLHKSYSGDNLITDSAAGATAFSAGVKTYNGAIGVGMDTLPVITILEMAETRGMPTGLIATSSIVHATPASFVAHNRYRKNYEEIAADFLNAEVDLLIGGGARYFSRRNSDERRLDKELERKQYLVQNYVDTDADEMTPDAARNYAYFTADGEPLPHSQGREYLVPAAKMAPGFLKTRDKDKKGFFLMIEGSQIDWGGHSNKSDYIISEMLEFDRAVGQVLDFAAADGNTLVIVTADHETGGYAIQNGSKMGAIDGAFTSDYHTADLIPVFAFGPGSERFAGIYENTAIFAKMKDLLGFR